jgi:copper transport protein
MPLFTRKRHAVVLALLALVPSLALASRPPLHLALKRSDPAADSRLEHAPQRISLWFTAQAQLAFTSIRLLTPSGEIALDSLMADTGNVIHARVPRALPAGDYTVAWRTASADGHPIRGEFRFSVSPIATDTVSAAPRGSVVGIDQPPSAAIPQETVSEYRTARWLEFVAMLTMLGVLGFRHAILPPLASRGVPTADAADRARRLGQSAVILYFVAAAVRLYAEAAALATPAAALSTDALFALLRGTTWGFGWTAGMVGALLLMLGWAMAKRSIPGAVPLALTGGLALVLGPALSGHAAASNSFVLSITLDMVHVAAAGLWLGGLLMVLVVGIPAMRRLTDGNPDAAVSALVNSFHPLALFCAPLVIVAGLGTSVLRLGGFDAITGTRYGQILLWKLALVAVVAGLGAYNSVRARKRLGDGTGTSRFRWSAAVELFFAMLVLAATTQLVTAPVPVGMVTP